ncbi:MAG: DUF3050 domain-containing protein [Rhodospirillales bacterium]|nr:DUF3050 domain-containing protein [Rhodospirillales bacterium]MCW9039882.1 DUF3050 domain-containing protein [Rhodospirillales bacterium]
MSTIFPESRIRELQARLADHPIYTAMNDLKDLRVFMEHHVYSVWDFMSLCKFLQNELAPSAFPWKPRGHTSARRFINEIVIEEESDEALPDENGNPTYASHFELYCGAMDEIGADSSVPKAFVEIAASEGIGAALASGRPPIASRAFMETTFSFIDTAKPHVVAAAFALGREHIIPAMFRSFLKDMKVTEQQAPVFHFYLNRHIHLDEDFHAPLSLLLLNEFCMANPSLVDEAVDAAERAVTARIAFWDGVLEEMGQR